LIGPELKRKTAPIPGASTVRRCSPMDSA